MNCSGPVPLAPATHGVDLTPEILGRCIVTLDGADVTAEVINLRAGTDGWVELRRRTPHPSGKAEHCTGLCPVRTMGLHMAIEYRTGDVNLIVDPT